MVRGFPVGSCILTPFDFSRGQQKFKFQVGNASQPNFHLLDGQQRATAIALGFLNPWAGMCEPVPTVLWVDLASPPKNLDSLFSFRVLTRSHPWGYQRNDPTRRIGSSEMRKALGAYQRVSPLLSGMRPAQLPLTHVWPWDAIAPIPVAMLIEAVRMDGRDIFSELKNAIEKLPFWQLIQGDEDITWPKHVRAALNGSDPLLRQRLELLCKGISEAVLESGGYGIPALVLPQTSRDNGSSYTAEIDPVETLFIRINTAGTKLEGEELLYSILKSAWPEAPQWIEKIHYQLMTPPRLVLLATRLVQASIGREQQGGMPPSPTVNGFRRIIHEEKFRDSMKDFLTKSERGASVIHTAKKLLEEKPHGLPPVLSAGIARDNPDVMLLLLRWIDLMNFRDPFVCLDLAERQRLVGMITAISWFAADSRQTTNILWNRLEDCPIDELPLFFSRDTFSSLLELDPSGQFRMLPIYPPDVLKEFILKQVSGPDLDESTGQLWTAWNWWERMVPTPLPTETATWYEAVCYPHWNRPEVRLEQPLDLAVKSQEAWRISLDRSLQRYFLLYAQRAMILKCFPDYDPSLPDQLEDTNRPWDYDHIHPNNYVAGRWHIPQIIKDWHNTIGNLRAWPFEANRADHDTSPLIKFTNVNDQETNYGLSSPEEKRRMSFVAEGQEWKFWQESTPRGNYDGKCLAVATPSRQSLIRAITSRFVMIYSEWYFALRINELMPN